MYCIAGFRKVKERQNFTGMANHNFRIHLTQKEAKRIDRSRSHLNRVLLNPLGVDKSNAKDLAQKIDGHYKKIGATVKANSVLAIDLVLTTSPEFFQDEKGNSWHQGGKIRPEFEKKIDDWVSTQIDFVKKQFGESAIKSAVLHLDETTPHIHFLITPEQTKELKYKNQYGAQSKIVTSLNADRWNPNWWKGLLTNYEKANKKFGLKKGQEGSMSKNVPLKEFTKAVSEASKADYSKVIEKVISDFGDDLSMLNTRDGVKKLLHEKLLPTLNPMLKQNKALKKVLSLDRAKEYKKLKDLIAENEKLKAELLEKRPLYIEAINQKKFDVELLAELNKENQELRKRVEKYEPAKPAPASDPVGGTLGVTVKAKNGRRL